MWGKAWVEIMMVNLGGGVLFNCMKYQGETRRKVVVTRRLYIRNNPRESKGNFGDVGYKILALIELYINQNYPDLK